MLAIGAALASPAAAAGKARSWAAPQIRVVTAHGLMAGGPTSFDRDLTTGELADLVTGLGGDPGAAPADPARTVTMAQLDSALVRGVGLGAAATRFRDAALAAGLNPPARFGTEVAARLLSLRTDHGQDALERGPGDPATRAEAAYSAARIIGWKGWEARSVRGLAVGFAPPVVSGWQQTVLREAVSLVGWPYVWAGTEERAQKPLKKSVPGGFDCSGFVWRIYKLASYAEGTPLAEVIQGRSTMEMAAETPKGARIRFRNVEPGDVLLFGAHGARSKAVEVDHAAIYLGGDWIIHSSGQGVALAPLTDGYRKRFAWARRPLAEAGLEP
jgi:hypothetical protein